MSMATRKNLPRPLYRSQDSKMLQSRGVSLDIGLHSMLYDHSIELTNCYIASMHLRMHNASPITVVHEYVSHEAETAKSAHRILGLRADLTIEGLRRQVM
jgi:hypothetical protein